jgi:hypothetical protein
MKDAISLRGCKNKELKYHLIGAGTVGRLVCLMKQQYGP